MTFFLAVKVNDLFLLGIWHYLRDGFSLKTLIGRLNIGLTFSMRKRFLLVELPCPMAMTGAIGLEILVLTKLALHAMKLHEGLVEIFIL